MKLRKILCLSPHDSNFLVSIQKETQCCQVVDCFAQGNSLEATVKLGAL